MQMSAVEVTVNIPDQPSVSPEIIENAKKDVKDSIQPEKVTSGGQGIRKTLH